MKEFLLHVIPVTSVELLAACIGLFYITNYKVNKPTRYFTYFLLFTVLVEVIGSYAAIAYFSDYKYFGFVKGTLFEENYWLYNSYTIISSFVYVSFFKMHLENANHRKILTILLILFVVGMVFESVFSETFFVSYSAYGEMIGTLLILLSISLYYYQLLTGDEILIFNTSLPFYISIGAILLHLVLTPIFIYSKYFDAESPEFVELYKRILLFTNLLVYLLYSFGFIICLKKKDSSSYIL